MIINVTSIKIVLERCIHIYFAVKRGNINFKRSLINTIKRVYVIFKAIAFQIQSDNSFGNIKYIYYIITK